MMEVHARWTEGGTAVARTKKVHIVGAGLSGMVAAINLAREGHQVIVLDGVKKVGDVHPHHPSNHTTPMDLDLIKNYVGIDITPCLTPVREMYVYINSKKYRTPFGNSYSVERGSRKTSLDTHLYERAQESRSGVSVRTGSEESL
jgi:monoamine oxidase